MAVVLAARIAGEHGVVNLEQAAAPRLPAPCVATGRMPHSEPPPRSGDRGAAMEAKLCRLASSAFEGIAKICQ